jgi:hypothetical protein
MTAKSQKSGTRRNDRCEQWYGKYGRAATETNATMEGYLGSFLNIGIAESSVFDTVCVKAT